MHPWDIKTMSNMPVVRQSSKLTDGGKYTSYLAFFIHAYGLGNAAWQKVLVALDGFLKGIRENRLNHEYRKALNARFAALEEAIIAHHVTIPRTARMDCRPHYIDFALTPECRAILDVPMSETVTANDFAAVIPALAQKWDADRRKEFTEYILPHLGDVAADVDPLELAISCFNKKTAECHGDIGVMRYPAILYHRCFTGPREGCYNTSTYAVKEYLKEDLYTRTTKTLVHMIYEESLMLCGNKFLTAHIPFKLNDSDGRNPGDVVNRMRRIVSAVGLDPTRATFEDLDRCDVWLRCVTCETEHPKDPIFARLWSNAVSTDKAVA